MFKMIRMVSGTLFNRYVVYIWAKDGSKLTFIGETEVIGIFGVAQVVFDRPLSRVYQVFSVHE